MFAIIITLGIAFLHFLYFTLVKLEKRKVAELKDFVSSEIKHQRGNEYVIITQHITGKKTKTHYVSDGNLYIMTTKGKFIIEHRMVGIY